MEWSFRRSVRMGPLRVSVSRSGVGASVGVGGARVGVGPRGSYVSFSGGGFQYQRKLTKSALVPSHRKKLSAWRKCATHREFDARKP
jgi:hypothetical protein